MVDKVEALEAQCTATLGEKKRLADEADTTANRLVRAEKLTSGLASEGVRWHESLESLGKQKVPVYRLSGQRQVRLQFLPVFILLSRFSGTGYTPSRCDPGDVCGVRLSSLAWPRVGDGGGGGVLKPPHQ